MIRNQRTSRLLLTGIVITSALIATLSLAANTGTSAQTVLQQPAPQSSPLGNPDPTPNSRCGVAGGNHNSLAALKISVGTPEPGGYAWNILDEENAVQMVRPCSVYGSTPLQERRFDCYDVGPGRIQGGQENETRFQTWVQSHPGLTWVVGNEPDLRGQDWLSHETYARMYHYYYSMIKNADPNARIAIGPVSQLDLTGSLDNRYIWLTGTLNQYQSLYGAPMPIDVWTFHMYNLVERDYGLDIVKEPINAFINHVRSLGYVTQPIWLMEWGKLNGWDFSTRKNGIPDDIQDPRMATLMRDWANWMQQDNKIERWFWFDTTMGDGNKDFEFDDTGWLFQESNSFYKGVARAGTTKDVVFGVPTPAHHSDWENAQFAGIAVGAQVPVTVTVKGYNPTQGAVTLSESIPGFANSADYSIFKSSYPTLTPNSLGKAYMYYCNPAAFSNHAFLPLVSTEGAIKALAEPSSVTTAFPSAAPSVFDSPLPAPPATQLVIDNFEYNDDPTNHGWYILQPQGKLETIAYKTPNHQLVTLVKYGHDRNFSYTYPGDPKSEGNLGAELPFLEFEFADYDGWSVSIDVSGTDGQAYRLNYRPQFGPPALKRYGDRLVAEYGLGEGYLDNQWHSFARDLSRDLAELTQGAQFQAVQRITFEDVKFLDNVALKQAPVSEDKFPPQVEIRFEGTHSGSNASFLSPLTFTAIANDGIAGTGVAARFLRVDGRPWLTDYGTSHVLTEAGSHVIEVYAVDEVGNLSAVTSIRVHIKQTQEGE